MLAGVLIACWAAAPVWWGGALVVAAAVALHRRLRRSAEVPATVLAALLLGAWLAASVLAAHRGSRFGDAHAGVRMLVIAQLVSLPARAGGQWRADAEVMVDKPESMRGPARRLRLVGPLGASVPMAGETWQLVIEVDPARARLNPGGFDLERQWVLQRIDGFGRVVDSPLNRRLAASRPGLLALRERIRLAIDARSADRELRALVTALAIGDTAAMTREQWRVVAATGTTHLVAISGLHVTLFAWLVGAAVRPLWRASRSLQRVPREALALPAGVAAAFGYSLLAGFSIPTQRTVLMLATVATARLSGRVLRPMDVLGVAGIGVLLVDPLAPLDVGFWLSFAAVCVLLLQDASAAPRRATWLEVLRARVWANLREQSWIGVALAPLTLLLFGTVSLGGWLANPLAIPVFSLLLVPLALCAAAAAVAAGTTPLADIFLWLAGLVHAGTWRVLRAIAGQAWALWAVAAPSGWFLLAPLALAIAWLPLPAAMRASALLCALPLVAGAAPGAASGEALLTILDAGEGGSVIVRTRHHALLYGTGASWGGDGAAVERHVLPALRAARIARLDILLVPRASTAEVTGTARLLEGTAVARIVVGGDWPDPPARTDPCPLRREWIWDGVRFELFTAQPPAGPGRVAAGSCVLRVATAGASALLVGAAVRADLDAAFAASLASDVLIGALRAVRSVAQREFTARVRPTWWVATRRVSTRAELDSLARAQGMDAQRMLAPSRHGALTLRLPRHGGPEWSPAVEAWLAPAWRQSRAPLPSHR